IRYMAGGTDVSDFGSPINWAIAIITLVVVLFCNHFTKGYVKLASILIGIIVGYIISMIMGRVDFTASSTAAWIQVPTPFHFGIKFIPSAIASISVIYIVNSVEAVGDLSAITEGGLSRDAKD
ncbi:purine permease, partial [Clostridium perfringens]